MSFEDIYLLQLGKASICSSVIIYNIDSRDRVGSIHELEFSFSSL